MFTFSVRETPDNDAEGADVDKEADVEEEEGAADIEEVFWFLSAATPEEYCSCPPL